MLNDDLSERSSEFSINDLILSKIRYKYPRRAVVEELQSSSGFYLKYVKIGYLSYSQRQKKVNYKETEETKIGRIVEECNTLQFNISKTKYSKLRNNGLLYRAQKILRLNESEDKLSDIFGSASL